MNPLLSQTHSEAKRRKNVFMILASLVAISVILLIVLALRQRSAEEDYYRSDDIKYGVHIATPSMADEANRRRQAYIDKAKRMREKWKPWAEKNRDLLARLVNAKSSDYATLTTVFNALPSRSEDAGLVAEVGSRSLEDLENPKLQIFSYEAFKPGKQHFSDAKQEKAYNKTLQGRDSLLKQDFDKFHDIALAESMSAGRCTIILWASGRITEATLITQNERGKPAFIPGPPQEIVGAYEFLK